MSHLQQTIMLTKIADNTVYKIHSDSQENSTMSSDREKFEVTYDN